MPVTVVVKVTMSPTCWTLLMLNLAPNVRASCKLDWRAALPTPVVPPMLKTTSSLTLASAAFISFAAKAAKGWRPGQTARWQFAIATIAYEHES